jgi:hypothetical protein
MTAKARFTTGGREGQCYHQGLPDDFESIAKCVDREVPANGLRGNNAERCEDDKG